MSNHKDFGNKGEKIAQMFLMKHGFEVIDSQYRTYIGEIDIIAEKDGILHFVEVKTVSQETYNRGITAEEHVSREKIARIERVGEHFMTCRGIYDMPAQVDVITIIMGRNTIMQDKKVLHMKPVITMYENVTRETSR